MCVREREEVEGRKHLMYELQLLFSKFTCALWKSARSASQDLFEKISYDLLDHLHSHSLDPCDALIGRSPSPQLLKYFRSVLHRVTSIQKKEFVKRIEKGEGEEERDIQEPFGTYEGFYDLASHLRRWSHVMKYESGPHRILTELSRISSNISSNFVIREGDIVVTHASSIPSGHFCNYEDFFGKLDIVKGSDEDGEREEEEGEEEERGRYTVFCRASRSLLLSDCDDPNCNIHVWIDPSERHIVTVPIRDVSICDRSELNRLGALLECEKVWCHIARRLSDLLICDLEDSLQRFGCDLAILRQKVPSRFWVHFCIFHPNLFRGKEGSTMLQKYTRFGRRFVTP